MGAAYDFLKTCGTFWVATADGTTPAARPFGAIAQFDGKLYISTADTKAVYRQLRKNPRVQLVALKPGTRDWIRVSGSAAEVKDSGIKTRMLNTCPALSKYYSSADDAGFAVFRIDGASALLCTDAGKTPVDI